MAENNIIKIYFSEFDLEFDHDLDCRNDFLEMNDGGSDYSPLIGRFCGNKSDVQESLPSKQTKLGNANDFPPILYSTQNKMWIRYFQHRIEDNKRIIMFPSSFLIISEKLANYHGHS